MKVGIVTDAMDGKMGGFGRYTRNLVRGLIGVKGISLYLIHRSKSPDPLYNLCNEILVRKSSIFRLMPGTLYQGLKLIKYDLDIIHYPHQAILSPLWRQIRLLRSQAFFRKMVWLPPSRKIVTIHGASPFVLPPEMRDSKFHQVVKSIKYFAEKIDMVITVSNAGKQLIQKYLGIPRKKIRVISNGVEYEKFRPLKNPSEVKEELRARYRIEGPFIYHVSSCQPVKNVSSLIKAFYEVRKRGLEHKLVITGSKGRRVDEILKTIKELHLEKDVIFTGHISNDEDLVKLYNAAELFVLPSFHESFPFPLLEAMACGSPVITSNVFSLPEIAGDAAILVDPRNIEEQANKMYEALTDEELRKGLRRRGLRRVKMFSLQKFVKEHVKVYKEIQ